MREAGLCGLDIDPGALSRELQSTGAPPNPCGSLHQSLQGFWWFGEFLPIRRYSWDDNMWHWHWLKGAYNQPRDVLRGAAMPYVALHHSVIDRLNQLSEYRPVNIPHEEATLRSEFKIES